MSTTLPPAPPRPPDLDRGDELEALIEEARRRARRRRALYGLSALFASAAAVAGFWGFRGGGGDAQPVGSAKPSAPASPQQGRPIRTPRVAKNGPLAIIDANSARIVLVGARGRFFRSLPICRDPQCGELQSVAWSPDGKTLAYGTASAANWHPRDGLHLFDVARNRDRRLAAGYANWQDLAWSPDGTKLAYVAGAAIYIIRIAQPRKPTELRAASTSPSWSPSGKQIVYDRFHGTHTSGISVSRADGSHVHRLSRYGVAPAWSPDGGRIAYSACGGIKLMTPTGKDLTPVSVWRCAHVGVPGVPTWSPDGRRIAISGANDGRRIAISGANGVYVMHADGGGFTKIWDGPSLRPSWEPIRR